MKPLHDLQVTVLYQLFALGAVLGPAMREGLATLGLSTARAEVIWRIHRNGPMNQRRLSEVLQCTPRNITGLVDALEGVGLVERRPHPTDRRATLVALTEEGRSVADSWARQSEEFAVELLEGFPRSELARLLDTLDKVLDRLGPPLDTDRAAAGAPASS